MNPGPAAADPGRDAVPAGRVPGPDDVPEDGAGGWRLVPCRADWPDDAAYLAALAGEEELPDPDLWEDPDNAPPPRLDDAQLAALIAEAREVTADETWAAAHAARLGTTGALAAVASAAGRRGPGMPGSAQRFPGEYAGPSAGFGTGRELDVAPGCAVLAGRELPPAEVLAADQRVNWWAEQLKEAGLEGSMDELRARAYLDLLLGLDSRPGPAAGHSRDGNVANGPDSHGASVGSGWERSGWERSGWERSGWERSGWERSGRERSGRERSGRERSGWSRRGRAASAGPGRPADGCGAARVCRPGEPDRPAGHPARPGRPARRDRRDRPHRPGPGWDGARVLRPPQSLQVSGPNILLPVNRRQRHCDREAVE